MCSRMEERQGSDSMTVVLRSRRWFLRVGILWAHGYWPSGSGQQPLTHPEPRPGITAARVVGASHLDGYPEAVPVFEMVRRIPKVVDGIRCHCPCGEFPASYSLLSCFEGEAMATRCAVCQDQARLAYAMAGRGTGLPAIRMAIDARFQ